MSNLLSMPLVALVVETATNEDWIDSIKYVVEDELELPQLDIRGIEFEMEVRRRSTDAEVVLSASTAAGTIQIGTAPDYGFFIFKVPVEAIRQVKSGSYIADVVGRDDLNTRRVMTIALTLTEGITKP